jgi:hypothetical protein
VSGGIIQSAIRNKGLRLELEYRELSSSKVDNAIEEATFADIMLRRTGWQGLDEFAFLGHSSFREFL